MVFKIIWSEQARDDLQSIVLFIAQDNPGVAESFGCLLMSKWMCWRSFRNSDGLCRKNRTKMSVKLFFVHIGSFTRFWRKDKPSALPASGTARVASRKFQAG